VELTIPGAVAGAAGEFGGRTALAGPGGQRLSYRGLSARVTTVAAALIEAGLAPGDRVAVWGPNDRYWVLAALGTLTAAGVLVPVSTRFTGPEALDVIGRSGASALFVAGDFLGVDRLGTLLRAAAAGASGVDGDGGLLDRLRLVVRVLGEWDAFERRAETVTTAEVRRRAGEVRPGDVSDIMFTSGTTGGARAR
jgi:HIP---CoA ligase